MIFSKRLLLKVVGGGIGLIGTGGAVLYGAKNSKKNGVDVDGEGVKSVKNVRRNTNSIVVKKTRDEKKKLETDSLGISVECKANEVNSTVNKKTCQLFDFQVEKIKFELANGQSKISLYGLSWDNGLTLTIEYTDDTEHFPDNKKYIFLNRAPGDNEIKMQNLKGGNVVLKINGTGFAFRKNGDGKLEKAPFEDKFGIPLSCQSYKVKAGKSQTCQLTETQLKKVKFEPNTSGGSISVAGLSGNNKVDLKIEHSTDKTNYPKNKKYTFTNKNNDPVTIKGTKDENIVLEKNKDITFGEKDGNILERVVEIDNLGIPRVCEKSECDLGEKDLKKIKFENFTDGQTTVSGLEGGKKIKLNVKKESKNNEYIFKGTDTKVTLSNGATNVEFKVGYYSYYEKKNNKLKFKEEKDEFGLLGIPSSKCDDLKNKKECEIDVADLKDFKFSIKGRGNLTISPESSSNKIKLKIEGVTGEKEYTDGLKYILKDIKENITISGTGDENKITFDSTNDDEMWFRKNEKGELEKTRTVPKVDNLGIPVSCDFKSGSDPKECDLKLHHLEKIKFSMAGSGNIKAVVTEGNPTIKLKREKADSNKEGKVYDKKTVKYTFGVDGGNIKVSKGDEEIHLKKGTNVEFKNENNELKKSWDALELGNRVNLACGGKGESCSTSFATVGVLYDGEDYEAEMSKRIGSKKFKPYWDEEGYNQGFKFVPEEEITLKSNGKANKNINNRDSFEIKYHSEKNKWYITKVSPK